MVRESQGEVSLFTKVREWQGKEGELALVTGEIAHLYCRSGKTCYFLSS